MCLAPVLASASMENLQWSLRIGERGTTESFIQNPEGIYLPHPLLAWFCNFSQTFSQAPQKKWVRAKSSKGLTLFSHFMIRNNPILGIQKGSRSADSLSLQSSWCGEVVNSTLTPASSTLNFSGIFTQCCIFRADINLCGKGIYSRPWLCSYWL